MIQKGNYSTISLTVELFPIYAIRTTRGNSSNGTKGNCSTISLTVELFPIYAIRTTRRK